MFVTKVCVLERIDGNTFVTKVCLGTKQRKHVLDKGVCLGTKRWDTFVTKVCLGAMSVIYGIPKTYLFEELRKRAATRQIAIKPVQRFRPLFRGCSPRPIGYV